MLFFFFSVKDLIDFCKETGLQSSTAATRNATIKLIGVLHKFVGPGDNNFFPRLSVLFLSSSGRVLIHLLADIKGFLTDVKPALLSALDAEYEKNPYEVLEFRYSHLVVLS